MLTIYRHTNTKGQGSIFMVCISDSKIIMNQQQQLIADPDNGLFELRS